MGGYDPNAAFFGQQMPPKRKPSLFDLPLDPESIKSDATVSQAPVTQDKPLDSYQRPVEEPVNRTDTYNELLSQSRQHQKAADEAGQRYDESYAPTSLKHKLWEAVKTFAPPVVGAAVGGPVGLGLGMELGAGIRGHELREQNLRRSVDLDRQQQEGKLGASQLGEAASLGERSYEAEERNALLKALAQERTMSQEKIAGGHDVTRRDIAGGQQETAFRRLGLDVQGQPIDPSQMSEFENARLASDRALTTLRQAQTEAIPEKIALAKQAYDKSLAMLHLAMQSHDIQQKKFDVDYPVSDTGQRIHATAQTKYRSETAQMLEPHIDPIIAEIQRLGAKGKLGPVAGRFEELWTGKGGLKDPEYAALRTQFALIQSGIGMMHGGARAAGSVQMLAYMKDAIKLAASDPANAEAVLRAANKWIDGYASGPGNIFKPKTGAQGGLPSGKQSGVVITHRWNPETRKLEKVQ